MMAMVVCNRNGMMMIKRDTRRLIADMQEGLTSRRYHEPVN